MKLRPVRRLHGLCLYCGRPTRTDVCGFCSDLPVRDPLVSKARQPLTEDERVRASAHRAALKWHGGIEESRYRRHGSR